MLRGGARRDQGEYAAGTDRGDRTGDDPLDAAQERRVRAVLALGGVPQSDLPDGVQQVRLRLLERTASGRQAPRDVSAWAAVVASNLAMDWHRAKRRRDRLGERLAALREPARPSGEETSLLSLAVAQGLDELPAAQRQVVVLRFFADLPVRAIAEELAIPEGTVKSRLHTAIRALRDRLHEDEVV
ncbi:RNA polymerase subunit sigma-70 [Streptomyces fodineus]|uniref:RNA polymerase subunit sigma-70 n=1 Tax=Streptomyces fodineus TaxID=1904616 RepID=A0A1D7YG54_9ACTN|nr:sigma-70 family RNA polymerase sigma factor [Streptomyces fodineus]AOR34319.1 RNA polymerase subunit sigma-70 [Streptomyces fodineus]